MKIIIAGSRSITEQHFVCEAVHLGLTALNYDEEDIEIVSGGARGVDQIGEQIAEANFWEVTTFIPEWDTYGKAAGAIRNKNMADYADALLYIWDGQSKGTKNMIDTMKAMGKPVWGVTIASQ